jgi:hypothetical protein
MMAGARAVALALVLAALFHTASVEVGRAQATSGEAEQVLEQFERALNAYDEDGVVQVFATDGTVRDTSVPNGVMAASQLRGWARRARERNQHVHLGGYSSRNGKTSFTIEVGEGEWHRNGGTPQRASGTAEVRGGRIVTLVIDPTATTEAAGPPMSVSPGAMPLVPVALAAGWVALVAAGLAHMRRRSIQPEAKGLTGMHSALASWSETRRLAAVAQQVNLPLRPAFGAGQPDRGVDVRQRVER